MSLKKTLTEASEKAAREAAEKSQREITTKTAIAEAFDTAANIVGYSGTLPSMVIVHELYGSLGSLHWRALSFDDALAIMRAFPAVPAGMYRDERSASFRPTGSLMFPLQEGFRFDEHAEGYAMRLSGGLEYGQKCELNWTASLAGTLVRFSVELRGGPDVLPRITCRTDMYQGRPVSIVRESERFIFPLGGEPVRGALYGSGSRMAFRSPLYVGHSVVDYVERAVAYLDEKGRETAAAYERAKAEANISIPTRAEIDAFAETIRENWKADRLRPGTLRQTAAMEMPAAKASRELAEHHWPRFLAATA